MNIEFRWLIEPYPDDSPVLQYRDYGGSGEWITVTTVYRKPTSEERRREIRLRNMRL